METTEASGKEEELAKKVTGRPRVYILDSAIVSDSNEARIETEILKGVATVTLLHVQNEEEFLSYASSVDALIVWHHANLTRLSISKLNRTQVIVRNGVGVDNVDISTAREFGIPVCNVPDYGTEEVADHALAMALSVWRQLGPLNKSVVKGTWDWRVGSFIRRIRGSVFGVVGCGRIGTATARRARVFGFNVIFYDPFVPSGYEKALGIGRVNTLENLLRVSDIVSLHVPLTTTTFHLLGEAEFKLMKPTSYLVNTSRGPVVEEGALVEALKSARLAGAALDVVEEEPNPPRDLLSRENCIFTPHAAFYSRESLNEMREKSAGIVLDVLLGRGLRNVVNGAQDACGTGG